ncbi:MAG: histidine kinase [Clostridia bacterium]|jgi:two-component system sensor histidine kinase YesM|nr:histidine kinase [Clostridia bacterium]
MSRFKTSINFRITMTVCVIVTISLLVSGGVAYYYNLSIMQSQCIINTTSALDKTSGQLEFFINDITKLGDNIAINEDVQNYLKNESPTDYYTKYSSGNRVKKNLAMVDVQRDYMYNSVLIKANEIIISSQQKAFVSLDDQSFRELMKQSWYSNFFMKKEKRYFSTPYQVFSSHTTVIPYIINVASMVSPTKSIGTLILNIDMKYIKEILDKNSIGFESYYLLDRDGITLYEKNHKQGDEILKLATGLAEGMTIDTTKVYETKEGYVFIDKTLDPGWTLVAYVLKQSIYKPTKNLIYFFIIYTMIIVICSIFIILGLVSNITKPLTELTKTMKKVAKGNLNVTIPVTTADEVGELATGFNNMLTKLTGYIDSTVEYEKKQSKMETSLLLAQINPHFIYNTLNTLIYMAQKIKAQGIIDMVRSFIVILQDVVKINEEGLFTTLEEEMDVVRQYLNIQQHRYKERFEVEWEIDETALKCSVPRTIIQPIVENCLLHGILSENEKGSIRIAVKKQEDQIVIEVTDNGVGLSEDVFKQMIYDTDYPKIPGKMRSVGMKNVQERITHLCGNDYGLSLQSKENLYTSIYIKLPVVNGTTTGNNEQEN